MQDTSIDIAATGFDAADVMRIFGDTMVAKADDTRFDELALKLDSMRETFKKIDSRPPESEFYFLAVFRDGESRDRFLKDNGLPDDRYQSGQYLDMLIKGEAISVSPWKEKPAKTRASQDKELAA